MIRWNWLRNASALAVCAAWAANCSGTQERPSGTGANEPAPVSSASPVAEGAGQNVSITFVTEPDPPKAGDKAFHVRVTGPDGSPVTDATVAAVFSMPAMPSMNMPAMRSTAPLAHEADGVYRGTGEFSMTGTWNVSVTVSRGAEELGRQQLSVIAK